jgi:hypothetical protein
MLYVGLDAHQESIAVASVAQDHGAEVVSVGTIGTRQCALDQRMRQLHAKAQHLVCGYEAGPCGYGSPLCGLWPEDIPGHRHSSSNVWGMQPGPALSLLHTVAPQGN